MAAIESESLCKNFTVARKKGTAPSVINAVRDVSFSVEAGEFLAFIGPNGAGKSTTIKMLTGIMSSSSGSISVLGMDPSRQRRQLAYKLGSVFGQKSQLWFHLPARESLELLGAIYEIERAELKRRTGELIEAFGLAEFIDQPVRKLSLGQRVRCEIAASLIHRPEIVFLDEPTIGLDVVAKQELREYLLRLNEGDGKGRKTTVFLTSHDVGDVEKVCRRAIIIHHGQIVVDKSVKDLRHQSLGKKIVSAKFERAPAFSMEGTTVTKATPNALRVEVDTRAVPVAAVARRLFELSEPIDLTIEDVPLEEIIADIYRTRSAEEIHERFQ
jgi:ABC-2 type transport system ATP-binding protein